MILLDSREQLLIKMEIRRCFSARRIPVFILLTLTGVFWVVQESEIPSYVIVLIVVFAILEAQFNNILFRSPQELEALSMFPVLWRRIVLIKNLSTIILAGVIAIITSMPILYFSPKHLEPSNIVDALSYFGTLIFVLLHVGNIESLRAPRRNVDFQTDDLVQGAGMLFFVVVLSIPYVVFSRIIDLPILDVAYSLGLAWHWLARSIPKTAHEIEQKKTTLCTTM